MALLVGVLTLAGSSPSLAQDAPEFKGHSVTDFPRVRHLIEESQQLLLGSEFEDAFDNLQEVIDRYPNQIYRGDDGIYHGAREYCMDLFARLDARKLAQYRAQYDSIAAKLYDRASEERDIPGLLEVVRRFVYTSYGPMALEQLGRLHHERGEWEEAIYYYRQSIDPGFGNEASPEILVRLAHCLSEAGDRDGVLALREDLEKLGMEARLRTAGEERDALSQYDIILDGTVEDNRTWSETWAQYGGNASHDFDAEVYRGPLSQPIVVRLDFDALDPYSVTRSHRYLMSRYLPDVEDLKPPFHPVVNASIAYIHDGLRIEAINLINGKRKWDYASEPNPVAVPHPRMIFGGAYTDGVVYAALETEVSTRTLAYKLTPIKLPMPRRKLHAFDAESGDLLWSHQNPQEDDPQTQFFLDRSSVCTPPLVWRENIYVGLSYFEGKIHSYVCCFDRRTGKLRWKTLVCTGQQELNMFGNQFMEYVASPLVLEDGSVYFVTNLGLAASLDARSGMIRWINEYSIIPLPHPQNFHPRIRRLSWYANPPYLHEGQLLATPLDSDELLSFDRDSGELMWTYERQERGRHRGFDPRRSMYALGVTDGKMILTGEEILAVDLDTREVAWQHPFGNPDEENILVDFTSDISEFNSQAAGAIQYIRFEVEFDLANGAPLSTDTESVSVDFLRIPFRF